MADGDPSVGQSWISFAALQEKEEERRRKKAELKKQKREEQLRLMEEEAAREAARGDSGQSPCWRTHSVPGLCLAKA